MSQGGLTPLADVRFWPKTDISFCVAHVAFGGRADMARTWRNEPKRTSSEVSGLRGDELNQEETMRKLSVAFSAAATILLVGSLAWKADAQTSRDATNIPVQRAACGGPGPYCPAGFIRRCGPHRCWCAPCEGPSYRGYDYRWPNGWGGLFHFIAVINPPTR